MAEPDATAPAPTPQQRLDAVRAAMAGVMGGGQRVRYKDREITYADFGLLREAEKAILAEINGTARRMFLTGRPLSGRRIW